MTVHVCVADDYGSEIWHFETVERAIAKAREEAEGIEQSGFWWNDLGFYMRYGQEDHPETRTIQVYEENSNGYEYHTWRVDNEQ